MNFFYQSLFSVIQKKLPILKKNFSIDRKKFLSLENQIKNAKQVTQEEWEEILQKYKDLQNEYLQISLKEELDNFLLVEEFKKLNLDEKFYPILTRDLTHLNIAYLDIYSIRFHLIDKILMSLYEPVQLVKKYSVALLTWVIADGYGDFSAQIRAYKILKNFDPNLALQCITLLKENQKKIFDVSNMDIDILPYKNMEHLSCEAFQKDLLGKIKKNSILVQIPTFYPSTKNLLNQLGKRVHYEQIGEYGFIESDHFCPTKNLRCMGLHPLEKGIFFEDIHEKTPQPNVDLFSQEDFLKFIFQSNSLNEEIIEKYKQKSKLFIAYLNSTEGAMVFFHALIGLIQGEKKHIDLIIADIGPFLEFFSKYKKKFSFSKIQLYFQGSVCTLLEEGDRKTLRIIHVGHISSSVFAFLTKLSEPFYGCRGDQSVTEAISYNKIYFYDGRDYAVDFLHDLYLIAKQKMLPYPHVVNIVKTSYEFAKLKRENMFIDEEKMGSFIAHALLDQNTLKGFYSFNQFIKEKFNFNFYFYSLIKRSMLHLYDPILKKRENQYLNLFLRKKISLKNWIGKTTEILKPYR